MNASTRHGYYTREHFSEKQQHFIHQAVIGKSLYLTGLAGSGKTIALKKVVKILQSKGRSVACCAPTGIAATNMGGQTIHSLFGIRPYGILSYEDCNFLKNEKRLMLSAINTLIIDEISMVRADLLDAINWTLVKNGCGSLSRIQVIFVGDMKQLPPVVKDNDRSVMYESYTGVEFFHAIVYQKIKPTTIELDQVFRQKDNQFVDNLNIIRAGGKSEYFKKFVHTETKGVILAPYKILVEKYNKEGLAAQKGKELVFKATIDGNAKEQDFNLEPEITIKHGCKIMYLVNSKDNPLVNGTIGIFEHEDVEGSKDGNNYIRVKNTRFHIPRVTLTKFEYVYNKKKDKIELKEIGSITQYPIRLAYALTIHKSQGMTLDEVTVDLTQPIRTEGMLYVALSRVRSPEGLRLIIQ